MSVPEPEWGPNTANLEERTKSKTQVLNFVDSGTAVKEHAEMLSSTALFLELSPFFDVLLAHIGNDEVIQHTFVAR